MLLLFLFLVFALGCFYLLLEFLSHDFFVGDLSVAIGGGHAGQISEFVLVDEVEFVQFYFLLFRVQHFSDLVQRFFVHCFAIEKCVVFAFKQREFLFIRRVQFHFSLQLALTLLQFSLEFLNIFSSDRLELDELSLCKGKSHCLIRLDLAGGLVEGLNILIVFIERDTFLRSFKIAEAYQ